MATIGLRDAHWATRSVTTNSSGVPTAVSFGTPAKLAPAISANIDIEHADATLSADDSTLYDMHPFKKGTIQLNVDDLPAAFLTAVLGMRQATNGVIVSAVEDVSVEVALGFKSKKANGADRCIWYPRVKFQIPSDAYNTKGDSITFNTPTITGTIMEELVSENNRHNWRYMLDSDAGALAMTAAATWLNAVPTGLTFS